MCGSGRACMWIHERLVCMDPGVCVCSVCVSRRVDVCGSEREREGERVCVDPRMCVLAGGGCVWGGLGERVCVGSVCVCGGGDRVCVWIQEDMCVCVCVPACVRVCVRACVCEGINFWVRVQVGLVYPPLSAPATCG